ncbi:hypothetical protein [Lacunimicrobium album]
MAEPLSTSSQETAVRAHDLAVCLERNTVVEFENIQLLGMAARLALHLRGVPAATYDIVKAVAVYLLDFPTPAVRPVLERLAEAEFVQLVTEGNTIKTVIPDIPFYGRLFQQLGEVSGTASFTEHEQLVIDLASKLSQSPVSKDSVYQSGAERRLIDRVLTIGQESAFLSIKRARGRDIILSPTYFSENSQAYADLVAGNGATKVRRLLDLLKTFQGWPLELILRDRRIGETTLDDNDLRILQILAGEGFCPPPAIQTTHAGMTHFLFGPRPGPTRLPVFKRPLYEAAMALVAAVRQGQLLPNAYRIRSPQRLLAALRDRKYLRANSEAVEQYRQLTALRVGRLICESGNMYRFELIDNEENREAVDLAISIVSGEQMAPEGDGDIILAMRQGESYVESLIGRKRLVESTTISVDEETLSAIDEFLLRGAR